ncbi:tRNA-dependent cyclodipeptide synthase [Spirosoma aerolatum]|uniref:tRNA-dependent cyclodipeptide synthase n=1 Tax=Spirosoma aerolatum TaxID=1211326 RepID=UPI0009AC61C3|nr:tRNA-dependent cyclodipeptide synthase [Spirosoma aerolatum]
MHSIHRSSPATDAFSNPGLTFLNQELLTYTHDGPEGIEGRLRILPVSHTRALQIGLDLLPQQPLVLLGISLGNTFFTRKRIEIAICGMAQLFGEVTIVIPDSVTAHTYRALGYDEARSKAKARTAGQKIKNRCLRAIERARKVNPSATIRILDWEQDISTLSGYWEAYTHACQIFDRNPHFQQAVLNKGYSVLAKRVPEASITRAAVRECIEYLFKEFAYLMVCRTALGRDLVIPYHQDSALGQRFCDGEYQEPLPGIGYLIFEIDLNEESNRSTSEATEPMLISAC